MNWIEKAKSQIEDYQIISFDIFDTLLLRPYVKPTDLFLHLEYLKEAPNFKDKRVWAEKKARQAHPKKEDITFDEIYREIPSEFLALKSEELALEKQVLIANPEMKIIWDYARSLGKTIIVTSDMYLPKKFLEDVLESKGFKGFKHLYISNEVNAAKATGSLYKYVIRDLNCASGDILHIGDNKESDYSNAKRAGIMACHYPKVIERLFETNIRAQEFYSLYPNDLGASVLLGTIALSKIIYPNASYWQDFGFTYGGPVLYGYVQWLEQQFKKDNIHEVMFVARDGYTLEKVFNILKTADIKTHYYYSPRILNFVLNLNYQDYASQSETEGIRALKGIFSYFKDKDTYLNENTPEIETLKQGVSFLEQNEDRFQKLKLVEIQNWQQYLKQFNLKSTKVALVDTVSYALSAQQTLIIGLPNCEVHGYYWLVGEGIKKDILKYPTSSFQESHQQLFSDWNMMEWYMTAPVPPIEKIENGKVIFKTVNEAEQQRLNNYPMLSEGIVFYAQFLHTIFGNMNLFMSEPVLRCWTDCLCKIATLTDIQQFKKLQHAGDFEHREYISFPKQWFSQPITPIKQLYHQKRILLFHVIPIIKKITKGDTVRYYLFNKIPILKKNLKQDKEKYYLFNKLRFLTIKQKIGNLKRVNLCGLCIFSVKWEYNLNHDILKKKYYIGSIRFLTVKKKGK